ncbi:MAG: GIY-YIG nuclease family protein [Acidobacteriota bacterium]|nr:GIY-YIG nuclease family protein [Acidobacteriota bacterium]
MPSVLKNVYCYQVGSGDCYKIGKTKNHPEKRKREFATGSPEKLELYRTEPTENASGLGTYIHQLLAARRTENGEFFRVTRKALDDAVDEAVAFMNASSQLLREAKKLRRRKPNDILIPPTPEMLAIYRQLREVSREKFLIERRIEFLQSKVQIAIGENRGMKDVASWKWVDSWTIDAKLFKKEHAVLYEQYKRDSGARKFLLERVDLTKE